MPRVVALLALIVCLLTSAAARATDDELQPAVLEFVVNGAGRGDVFVLLREGDVLVPLESLRKAGIDRLEVATLRHDGVEHVSMRAASPPLSYSYDEPSLTLSVTAPPSVLERTSIDLSTTAPEGVRYDHDPSVFVNYAPRLIDGQRFEAFTETGLSLGSAVALNTASYDPTRGPQRLVSQVVIDDRERLRSATFGDSFTSAGPLGGALMLGGISVARNYALDPYLVKVPRLGFTGSAMAPSTVDVYVNDMLVRRVPVEPGEFELLNVTPVTGAGTARYVLRDAYGREQRLESTYYASGSVLAPGLSEYTHSIGLIREDYGSSSFSYGEPAYVGRHRFGLSRHVTTGLHAEVARTGFNFGTEATVALGFGEIEVHSAGSVAYEPSPRHGVAGLVGYGYRTGGTSLRTVLRGATAEYSNLTLSPEQDRGLIEHVTTTGHAIGSRLSFGTQVAFALLRDQAETARLSATLNLRLTQELSWQLSGSRSYTRASGWQHDAFAMLTWSLPGYHTASVGVLAGDQGDSASARISRPIRRTTDVGYQLSGTTGDVESVSANVQAQSTVGRVGATYTNLEGDEHTIVEASGSLVFVGGNVFFARPTTQSFAVLEVPGVPGVRGYLNNREMGTTDSDGQLFVPDLLPYQGNRLSVAAADLPFDYQLEQEEVTLAPPTRGGAVVTFAARQVRLVRGRLVADGDPTKLRYGELIIVAAGESYLSPIGAAGEFELDGVPPGNWRGQAHSEKGSCQLAIEVGGGDDPIEDVGVVSCKTGKGENR